MLFCGNFEDANIADFVFSSEKNNYFLRHPLVFDKRPHVGFGIGSVDVLRFLMGSLLQVFNVYSLL